MSEIEQDPKTHWKYLDEDKKKKIQNQFLEYCEKVGYGEITIIVEQGTPKKVIRGLQKVRLDLPLTRNSGDTTME